MIDYSILKIGDKYTLEKEDGTVITYEVKEIVEQNGSKIIVSTEVI